MKSKLIVIEGLDGCGKNTQTKLLAETFLINKINFKYLSFPNYSSPSSSLVKMYLGSEFGKNPSDVNAYAAASFFSVDRYASFKTSWEKLYFKPGIILCDRYTTSNTFYHMCKLPENEWDEYLTWLYDYEYNKLGLPEPDAVIYLDMPPEVSQDLMKKRYSGDESKKDIHESDVEYLKKCRKAAEYVRNHGNWFTVCCVQNGKVRDKNQIHNEIITFLRKDVFNEDELQKFRDRG